MRLMGLLKIADNSIDYSLGNTTKQALWLPTSREASTRPSRPWIPSSSAAETSFRPGSCSPASDCHSRVPAFAAMNIVLTGFGSASWRC